MFDPFVASPRQPDDWIVHLMNDAVACDLVWGLFAAGSVCGEAIATDPASALTLGPERRESATRCNKPDSSSPMTHTCRVLRGWGHSRSILRCPTFPSVGERVYDSLSSGLGSQPAR